MALWELDTALSKAQKLIDAQAHLIEEMQRDQVRLHGQVRQLNAEVTQLAQSAQIYGAHIERL